MRLVGFAILSAMAAAAQAEPGTVTLRTGQVVQASEIKVSTEAVVVVTAGGERTLGWHEVRAVGGRASASAVEYLADADDAWRGLTRLERGDRVAAEPLLERVFEPLAGHKGPTATAVSEGLLSCRVARGAQALAIEPYLTLVLNNPVEVTSDILDERTALYPALPPIWGSEAGLASAVTSVAWDEFAKWESRGRARQLAELYTAAALYEISGESVMPTLTPIDEGVQLVHDMVASRIGSERERAGARASLKARLEHDLPDWQRAWVHAAIGLSLLAEDDTHESRLGIVQLLYVPAQYAQTQPYLAGVCLAKASIRLAEMGRSEAAVTLAGELAREYKRHISIEHPIVRELIRQYQNQSTPAAPSEEDA